MPNRIKLFLADDLLDYRAWVHSAIALNLPQFRLIGHGDSFSGIMDSLKQELPDVLILDFATGNFKIASAIKRRFPQIRIFLLSESNAAIKRRHASRQEDIDDLNLLHPLREKEHLDQIICNATVLMMLEIGRGILFHKKSITKFELSATGRGAKYSKQSINGKPSRSNHTILTKREIDVVKLLCRELTNEEIANKLHIDIRTVHTHRENILKKVKAKNIAGIIKFAFNNKLYP